ncbi:hypothetical protein L9Z41_01860 [Leptospira noguchii]|uniref:hypothetical protein n=1 Tax=Leptospira noguchii TaxID=28182 RepID=UPI001F05C6AC|nr:hypothetical protein [Leptospira noguchii]MCH1911389.1 hypothetical protein [Leptospira noguchii]MCH1914432.1 hypothetical protein [Leptospira noguchii]UOG64390.1 hypothetical protein MAL04_01880 [Leptospira noguchii]
MHRSLRVALQGRVNSAKRSPELNASLPMGRSAGSRFRVNKLNLKTIVVLCFLYTIY